MVNGIDLKRARECASQACILEPKDPEAHFTAGMIAARMGNVAEADESLKRAQALGKAGHLCALQKARARLEMSDPRPRDIGPGSEADS